MKKKILFILILISISLQYKALAQNSSDKFEHDNQNVYVSLNLAMTQYQVEPNDVLVLTPLIESAGEAIALPDIVLYGRNMNEATKALSEIIMPEYTYTSQNMQNRADLAYQMDIPYEPWMESASLKLQVSMYNANGVPAYSYSDNIKNALIYRGVQENNSPSIALSREVPVIEQIPESHIAPIIKNQSQNTVYSPNPVTITEEYLSPIQEIPVFTEEGYRIVETPDVNFDSGVPTFQGFAISPAMAAKADNNSRPIPLQRQRSYADEQEELYSTSVQDHYSDNGYKVTETPDVTFDSGMPVQLAMATTVVAPVYDIPKQESASDNENKTVDIPEVDYQFEYQPKVVYSQVTTNQGYNSPMQEVYTESGFRKVDTPDVNFDSGLHVEIAAVTTVVSPVYDTYQTPTQKEETVSDSGYTVTDIPEIVYSVPAEQTVTYAHVTSSQSYNTPSQKIYTESGFRKVDTPDVNFDSGMPVVQENVTSIPILVYDYETPKQAIPSVQKQETTSVNGYRVAEIPTEIASYSIVSSQQNATYTQVTTDYNYSSAPVQETYTKDGYRKVDTPDVTFDSGMPIQIAAPNTVTPVYEYESPRQIQETVSEGGYRIAEVPSYSAYTQQNATYTQVTTDYNYNAPTQETTYKVEPSVVESTKVSTYQQYEYNTPIHQTASNHDNFANLTQPSLYSTNPGPTIHINKNYNTKTNSYKLYFGDKKSYRVTDTNSNTPALENILSQIDEIQKNSNLRLISVNIVAGTSIDGTYSDNEQLTKKQALEFKSYLQSMLNLSDSYFYTRWISEDWTELCYLIQNDPNMPNKYEVLDIIQNTGIFTGREKRLMTLAKGNPYRYMTSNLLAPSRKIECTIVYETV